MGSLNDVSNSRSITLEPENLVGRSPRCSIQLTTSLASSVHASLRWTPLGWELRDLSSTNGTFLNGQKVVPGKAELLKQGDVIAFGSTENGWALVDELPPGPVVVSEHGDRAWGTDLIALPSSELPLATLYRAPEGTWCLERPGEALELVSEGVDFAVAGKSWRLFCPELVAQTASLQHGVRSAKLLFVVSSDEERVELTARVGGESIDLGARANNYLLLTLARQRLKDESTGCDELGQGWVHQEALSKALASDSEHINVDVFRIRKRFERHFQNAAQVIERKPGTGQLRLGVRIFEIKRA